jgi:MYXO-CTERM domain-containing protein
MDAFTLVSRIHFHRRSALAAALVGIPLVGMVLHASPAGAQEACGDTSCGLGTACATDVQGCPPCLEGESSCGVCEPETSFYCTPAECESAADCASHMACVERPQQQCEGQAPSCVEGESDAECIARVFEWQAENCQTVTPLLCTPRWQLPCQADADCGAKLRCDGGACTLIDEFCSEDADCPVTWVCAALNVGQCQPVPGGDDDGECVYNQPPVQRCIEPSFAVREESGGGDEVATAERDDAAPAPNPADDAGCAVAATRSDASPASVAGLLALALLGAGRALQRRSAASR